MTAGYFGPRTAGAPQYWNEIKNFSIRASGFFEGIREDRQAVEGAIRVDCGGEELHGRREPGGIGDDGSEGVAEDVAEWPFPASTVSITIIHW